MVKQLVGGSGNQELYTPSLYIALVKQVLGERIDLDPFSCEVTNKTVGALRYYSLERGEDGYTLPWYGHLFINPPYGRDVLRCVQKLIACYDSGEVSEAIILLRSGTSTEWLRLLYKRFIFAFAGKRIKFINGEVQPYNGHYKSPNTGVEYASNILDASYDTVFFYLGHHEKTFINTLDPVAPIGFSAHAIIARQPKHNSI